MISDQALFLDDPDEIQHLLGTAHSKRWNDHIAAPVKSPLDHSCQFRHIVRSLAMASVAISRFHDHIVRIVNIGWIVDQGLVCITDITGKDQLLRHILFCDPDFNAGRAKQVAGVDETDADPVADLDHLVVTAWGKVLQDTDGIFRGIDGHEWLCAGTFALSVAPLRLKFLDMGTVTEHDIAKVLRRLRRKDRPLKALLIKERKHTGMVDVGMGQEDIVDIGGRHRDRYIFKEVSALLHTTINKYMFTCDFQIMLTACYLVCCT